MTGAGSARGSQATRTLWALAALTMTTSLMACRGGSSTPPAPTSSSPSGPTSPSTAATPPSTPPSTPPTTTASARPSVTITDPKNGDLVGVPKIATGQVTGLAPGQLLWAVVQPLTTPNYHPQASSLLMDPNGNWRATCHFGTATAGRGEDYALLIVSTTKSADLAFRRYLSQAEAKGYDGLPSLPSGTTILTTITVRRS